MEYITRGPCGQEGCREKRYYLDNGLWFCRRGHQQEGRQVEEDPEDFGTQGKTSRVKKAAAEKSQKKYRGRQAYDLFLQAYQLILWKQCHALVNGRGFPAQLEDVVRDLWALRLETLANKIQDPNEEDTQPEFFSSQPGPSRDESEAVTGSKVVQWPRLIDTVALCYLGAFLMRLPVSIADFHRMMMRGDIPFVRILIHIPRDVKERLPQEYIALLETTKLPKAEYLHTATFDLFMLYKRKFKMNFPPLNTPALLYRCIRRLALPLDIYPVTRRLQDLLSFTFEFPANLTGGKKPLHLPEIQLMTLIVIATKLLFPFDGIERHPNSAREPTVQTIDWAAWTEIQGHFDHRETSQGKIGKGREILVNEHDVFRMTPDQLDEYMDWYENSWLDTRKGADPLANLFPLGSLPKEDQSLQSSEENEEEVIESMLQRTQGLLQSRTVCPEGDPEISRPGSSYARYRHESDLPDEARSFYETAAKVAGVSLSTLVRAVSQAEVQINKWLENKRRMEYFEGQVKMRSAEEFSGDDLEDLNE